MKPYQPEDLPLKSIDWASHVPLIAEANRTLARYDGMLQSIVNPGVLLSPLTTQEAVLSSRIEGTQASMEEVMEYQADPNKNVDSSTQADIQEIMNYRKAMGHAVESFTERPLCLNLIKELHGILLDSVRGRNKNPGEFRRSQNYIALPDRLIEEAEFIPPSVDRMIPALDNWEKYCHYEEKDRLVQLAVVKAQFELIHPFLDGNGRIGRMLVPIFLFDKKILSSPMFYLSTYLEANREAYYHRLQAISREGDWNGWIKFFLHAILEQAGINVRKIKEILALYDRMKKEVPETTRSQYAIGAIDAIFDKPIFTSSIFIDSSNIPRESAHRILAKLKKKGFLKEIRPGKGRRPAVLIFTELISITESTV